MEELELVKNKSEKPSECVRQRKVDAVSKNNNAGAECTKDFSLNDSKENVINELEGKLDRGSYWLTRIFMIRYLGFIYFVAFLVALHQNKQLLGSSGLLPANNFLNKVKKSTGGIHMDTFSWIPSLIWFIDYDKDLDWFLDTCAYSGLALSSILIIHGGANCIIMLSLWILYHSIVNIGSTWYGFGWESQLLETGFLAVFLCPVWNMSAVPKHTPTSLIVLMAFRWLIFRIMIGAVKTHCWIC